MWPSTDLTTGIVRILDAQERTVGTGFVVSGDGLVVTCAHVIASAGSGPGKTVQVAFHATGEQRAAQVVPEWWRGTTAEDVAVLRVEGALPEGVSVLSLASSARAKGRSLATFGFPSVKPLEGLAGQCEVIGRTTERGFPVLQLRSTEVTPGFSGAPVLDPLARGVVGMVNAITMPDPYERLGETVFILAAETLWGICPPLRPGLLQRLAHGAAGLLRRIGWLRLAGFLVLIIVALGSYSILLSLRPRPAVLFVVDASSRMLAATEGGTRMDVTCSVLLEQMSRPTAETYRMGLVVFGQHSLGADSCADIEQVVGLGNRNSQKIVDAISGLQAGSPPDAAPLSAAIVAAIAELASNSGPKTVVVITGGGDTCAADGARMVQQELARAGVELELYVIGYNMDQVSEAEVLSLTDEVGGTYYAASTAAELADVTAGIIANAPPPTASPAPPMPTPTRTPEPLPPIPTSTPTPVPTSTPIVIRPGQTYVDHTGDADQTHIDVVSFSTTLEGETLQVTYQLVDIPSLITFDRDGIPLDWVEYGWEVYVDPQGRAYAHFTQPVQVGEYLLQVAHVVRNESPRAVSLSLEEALNVTAIYIQLEEEGRRLTYVGNVAVEVDPAADTITLRTVVPGISPNATIFFRTVDYLGAHDYPGW
ncbi:MAG: trypsin-like peptidase domain-containing protein [Anaerolineae bacterium]|nr:trypsin-like peptidase domain-containing protein [Anaerolineae bacterium]